jgi:quinol monooxygenase YgiN
MIKLSIKVKTRPGKKKEFLRALLGFRSLQGLIEQLRKENGCLKYQILKDKDQKDEFIIESEWRNKEAFKLHCQGRCFTILLGAIGILCKRKEMNISDGKRIIEMNAGSDDKMLHFRGEIYH